MKTARERSVSVLRTARLVGTVAMLGVVLAGALGYGDDIKLYMAAGGVVAAIALKVLHIVA